MRRLLVACVIALAAFAAVSGTFALSAASSTPVEAKTCGKCPMVCYGVTCDDGKVYCNACLAACAGAHHCVPGGAYR